MTRIDCDELDVLRAKAEKWDNLSDTITRCYVDEHGK